jgi:isoleucyl-tRNA synthetase
MSDKDKKKGYRDTLNLPKTAFAMKANLTQREPQMRKDWDKQDIYNKILAARADAFTWATSSTKCSRILSSSTRP